MAQIRGRNVAAVARLPPGQEVPPHWNSYVTVADVDATAARAPDACGTLLMPPFDVMDAGRMALVQDPTGGVVALWQAKNDIGAQLVNEHGSLCWNELHTPDVATASAFYSQLLGWQPTAMPDMGEYRVLMLGENGIAGAVRRHRPRRTDRHPGRADGDARRPAGRGVRDHPPRAAADLTRRSTG